jgi:protein RecA
MAKKEKIDDFSKKIKKMSSEYKSLSEPEFIKSGSVVIDAILGGGVPQGVFILLSSDSGLGKSTASLHISKAYCMQSKRVLYLDFESGVNSSQLNSMGLSKYLYDVDTNPDGIFYLFQIQTYREADKLLDELVEDVDLVVIDSASAMLTEKVKDSSSEDVLPGIDSRVMSTFLKRHKASSTRAGTSWIIVNQLRTKIAMSYGQQTAEVEAGGKALKFYPDIRLTMKKAFKGTLERTEITASGEQKVPFGAICEIKAVKNRYERPEIPLRLAIIFGKGISNEYAYVDFLEQHGKIVRKGAWYTINLGDSPSVQGMNGVIEWVNANKGIIKDYIESEGGYRLLLNEESSVDLVSDSYDEEVLDGTEVFDETGDEE